jgi:putative nucleotidyltransferase with HDIG domain
MYLEANYIKDNEIKSLISPSEIIGVFQNEHNNILGKEKVKKYLLESILHKLYNLDKSESLVHLKMVGKISGLLSKKLGFSEFKTKKIEFFAKLHDIGKISIPENIINKPGKLTIDEFEIMKEHTEIGYHMMNKLGFSKIGEDIIRYHHEKWNGKGYRGLSKNEIPIEARIVAISDVYDALRMKRPYKDEFSHEKAVKIIKEGRGEDFDPELVDLFLSINKEIESIYLSYIN